MPAAIFARNSGSSSTASSRNARVASGSCLASACRPLARRAEQLPDGRRAPLEERDVVLPGVADAAEHRHAVEGDFAGARKARDGGFAGGELQLRVVLS